MKTINQKILNKNQSLNSFPEQEEIKLRKLRTRLYKLEQLEKKLSLCGEWATKKFYCKKCESEGKLEPLKIFHKRFYCEIRYCNRPKCLINRFVRQMQTFEEIKRFNGLKTLWHFSIGFPIISLEDFKKNFSKIKKRQEYVLNRYFERLRKIGINIQAVRVLDFSFMKEGQVYLHYHFGALPKTKEKIGYIMTEMKGLAMSMSSRMRNKTTIYLKSYGLKKLYSVLSYLSIRASGMYKYDTTKNFNYKVIQGKLMRSIIDEKYIFLSSVLTQEEYLNSFYSKAHFICVGGLPRPSLQGSNITDGIPLECLIHGVLTRKDVRIKIIFDDLIKEVIPPPILQEKMEILCEIVR